MTDILEMLAGGAHRAEPLQDFPYLEDTDITAALEYAARQTNHPDLTRGLSMRFLVDPQLPPALVRWLADKGFVAQHVFDLRPETVGDAEIR